MHPGVPALPACFCDIPTPRGTVCVREGKKNFSYHVCITFRHITFGRTPGVLAILTRPLHTQRTKNTEGVNQSSCTVGKSRNQETVYSGKIHTQRTPPPPALLPRFTAPDNSSESTFGLMGKQTNRITLKAYEIHPPLSCSCNTLLR